VADKKIIVVVGATGAQGGGLARAILADPDGQFTVRAVTRDPGSAAARELARGGAEVVRADVDDEASLRRALRGAYGAFFVTAFWEYGSVEREQAQALAMARAAKAAGLQHAIWSTLPDTRLELPIDNDLMPTLQGRYNVPHFDSKGEANSFFTDAGVPTTFLSTTFYFEGFTTALRPTRGEDGKLVIMIPMGERKLAGIAAEDIGRTAYGIFKRGNELIGTTVSIAGEHLTGAEYAAVFSKVLGEEVVYRPMSFDAFRALGFSGADDIANTFQYYYEFEKSFIGARDLDYVRTLNPDLQDFATWLNLNKDKFAA
jgi:uncharacterized protein YbjT (DUF2867 family)